MRTFLRSLVLCAGLALLSAAGPSHAQVISFEDIVAGSVSTPCFGAIAACPSLFLDSGGYRFTSPETGTSNHAHLISPPFFQGIEAYASNESQYIGLDSGLIVMQRVGGGAFSLLALDASEGFISNGLPRAFASSIRVEGTPAAGGMVSADFQLDQVNDGPGSAVDFQSVILPASFSGLVSVSFVGLGTDGLPGFAFVNLDNISVLSIPEPKTYLLMLAGVSILSFAMIRRRRA